MVVYWNTFVETCQTVHLKWIYFIEYKLYLNKVDLNFENMNNTYTYIPDYMRNSLSRLISSIITSVWSICISIGKVHKISLISSILIKNFEGFKF